MAHDIFISYCHDDKTTADAACAILESEGLRCWIAPRDILPGNEWTESIMEGIIHAKALVLIFSHHSDASPQVHREVERAIHHGIPVVPVRIEDVLPGEAMEYLISTPHWLDAISAPLEAHYRRLAASLKMLIEQRNGSKPAGQVNSAEAWVPKAPPRTSKLPKLVMLVAVAALVLAAGIYGGLRMAHRQADVQVVAQPSPSPVSPPPTQLPPIPPNPPASVPSVSESPVTIPALVTPRPSAQAQMQAPSPSVVGGATITNSIGMKFVEIKPGTFLMGSPPTEDGRFDNEIQHRVTLTKGFFMGQTHVTVEQFTEFANSSGYLSSAEKRGSAMQWTGQTIAWVPGGSWRNPGFEQERDHPVVDVDWDDAIAFCAWIGGKEGKRYRLPTEAECEYCARAGTTTAYQWGDNPDDGKGWGNLKDVQWRMQFPQFPSFTWSDGYLYTSPSGKFRPNAWNIYDMPGNVYDWCSDWYGEYPDGDVTDPQGPAEDAVPKVKNPLFPQYSGPCRDIRGGSWATPPRGARVAARIFVPSFGANSFTGFRIVLDSR